MMPGQDSTSTSTTEQRERELASLTEAERRAAEVDRERARISGPGKAVDHEREPGVPPPSTDDYEDMVDIEGAESFPASDPPSGW